MLEELCSQAAVNNDLAVEIDFGRNRRAHCLDQHLPVTLLSLKMQRVLILFPKVCQPLVAEKNLFELSWVVSGFKRGNSVQNCYQAPPMLQGGSEKKYYEDDDQHRKGSTRQNHR